MFTRILLSSTIFPVTCMPFYIQSSRVISLTSLYQIPRCFELSLLSFFVLYELKCLCRFSLRQTFHYVKVISQAELAVNP